MGYEFSMNISVYLLIALLLLAAAIVAEGQQPLTRNSHRLLRAPCPLAMCADPCAQCNEQPGYTCVTKPTRFKVVGRKRKCPGCPALVSCEKSEDGGGVDVDGCTFDAKVCDDGSTVGRDAENNCEFFPCPDVVASCSKDLKVCDGGARVGRDPSNDCKFFPCPPEGGCTEDAKVCDDGSTVGRDPNNDCEFSPCPTERSCGTTVCGEGLVCCNASCGICTKPGMACIQLACDLAP